MKWLKSIFSKKSLPKNYDINKDMSTSFLRIEKETNMLKWCVEQIKSGNNGGGNGGGGGTIDTYTKVEIDKFIGDINTNVDNNKTNIEQTSEKIDNIREFNFLTLNGEGNYDKNHPYKRNEVLEIGGNLYLSTKDNNVGNFPPQSLLTQEWIEIKSSNNYLWDFFIDKTQTHIEQNIEGIVNVPTPTKDKQIANKEYVDSAIANNGGGNNDNFLDINQTNKEQTIQGVVNVPNPTKDKQIANKEYVDSAIANNSGSGGSGGMTYDIQEDTQTHIIRANQRVNITLFKPTVKYSKILFYEILTNEENFIYPTLVCDSNNTETSYKLNTVSKEEIVLRVFPIINNIEVTNNGNYVLNIKQRVHFFK